MRLTTQVVVGDDQMQGEAADGLDAGCTGEVRFVE